MIVVSLMECDRGDRLVSIVAQGHREIGFLTIFHDDVLVESDLVCG